MNRAYGSKPGARTRRQGSPTDAFNPNSRGHASPSGIAPILRTVERPKATLRSSQALNAHPGLYSCNGNALSTSEAGATVFRRRSHTCQTGPIPVLQCFCVQGSMTIQQNSLQNLHGADYLRGRISGNPDAVDGFAEMPSGPPLAHVLQERFHGNGWRHRSRLQCRRPRAG